MKTTKLIAIAVLILGITSLGYSQPTTPRDQASENAPKSIVIPFKKAVRTHQLVQAMRTQLTPQFLEVEKQVYTVSIKHKSTLVYVSGTLREWKGFFRISKIDDPLAGKSALIQLPAAIRNPQLVKCMRSQLTPRMLKQDKNYYTAPVRYKHSVVYVGGTFNQWLKFFSVKPKGDPQK